MEGEPEKHSAAMVVAVGGINTSAVIEESMSLLPSTGTDSNSSPILSDKTFDLLMAMGLAKAGEVLKRMIASRDVQKIRRAFEILARRMDPELTFKVCATRVVARKMGLSEVEWEILKRIRRADAEFNPSGIEIEGYLDLSGISGPCSIPISKVDRLNMAYSSALSLPNLRTVSGEFLNLVGTSGIRIPTLEKIAGEVSACRASDLYLPALERVGGNLDLHEAGNVDLPKLTWVGRKMSVQDAKDISVPCLVEVNGSLNIRGTQRLSGQSVQRVRLLLHDDEIDLVLPSLLKIGKQDYLPKWQFEGREPPEVLVGSNRHHAKNGGNRPPFLGNLGQYGVLSDWHLKRSGSRST